MNTTLLHLNNLQQTINTLRGENGCPWDKKQTAHTLRKYLKEEMDELLAAIEADDHENTCEEIGDVFYVLMMIATTYSEKNMFSIDDCLKNINSKLIRRHPHVFEGKTIKNEDELKKQWERIKKNEKKKNI